MVFSSCSVSLHKAVFSALVIMNSKYGTTLKSIDGVLPPVVSNFQLRINHLSKLKQHMHLIRIHILFYPFSVAHMCTRVFHFLEHS